jgi:UDP-glucose 4-epimerase
MRILVTGGAGYIGSIVSELALKQGHELTVIDNLQEGHRRAVPPGARFIQGDLGDAQLLDRTMSGAKFEGVIHLAAETTVAWSVTDPGRYFAANMSKGLVLLEAMRRHHVTRMIFSSTAATYGEPTTVPITESHPQIPINAYGESKLMFERCLDWFHRAYGMRAVCFRYFNAAGASKDRGEAHLHETHLIPLILDTACGLKDAVNVHGCDYPTKDGTCVRDFVHVEDIAQAHLLALEKIDTLGFDVFNIGSGTGYSVLEVIAATRRVTGRAVNTRRCERRPGDPATLVASADKIRRVLGWKPKYPTLDAIVSTAWAWKERFPSGYEEPWVAVSCPARIGHA